MVVCGCATQDDSDFMSLMMAAIGSRRTAIEYVSSPLPFRGRGGYLSSPCIHQHRTSDTESDDEEW